MRGVKPVVARGTCPAISAPETVSIVVPVLNEASGIHATLERLQPMRRRGAEIIVVDGGSQDNTVALCQPLADSVLQATPGRARQMNAGAAQASGKTLLFLHADTLLPPDADTRVGEALARGARWGRFDVRIAGSHWMLPVIAFMMNQRSRLTGIATGDQAIFVRRDAFDQVGGFPDQPLMEDIDMSAALKRQGWPACLRESAVTSGRRWETRGVWRTIALMWHLRWRHWRGDSPQQLAQRYR